MDIMEYILGPIPEFKEEAYQKIYEHMEDNHKVEVFLIKLDQTFHQKFDFKKPSRNEER